MAIFVNFSNHGHMQWDEKQKEAANVYGSIVDMPFPVVPAIDDEEMIAKMAEFYTEDILRLRPAAVMCQGEFTLAYGVINRLRKHGVTVLAACTERIVDEYVDETGQKVKKSFFRFICFRQYE